MMKILYTSSSKFYKEHGDVYKKTLDLLQNTGHKVSDYVTHILEDFGKAKSEEEITKAAQKQINMIKDADLVIADITNSTGAVGFHISSALSQKKPVLVLSNSDISSNRIPGPIKGNKSRLMDYQEYKTTKDIEKIVNSFLKSAKQNLDTKFILIIPADIDRYLEWASDYKRMHKAQIVRQAIEDYMEGDQDWKEFLSEE